ncbi:hypothetical protein BJV78DRAFT_695135 [Lactifluus subvellereus]|nr:hypothetical protein BJV78DRAFT_695135 [Lactifluus subvellereus]
MSPEGVVYSTRTRCVSCAQLITITNLYDTGLIFQRVTIGSLPDNVLLKIFDFYRMSLLDWRKAWPWHMLVHVCRRWRCVVSASPIRLNLQLLCTRTTPVRKTLDIWPCLPIIIKARDFDTSRDLFSEDGDNVIAALEHPDRVCQIHLGGLTNSLLEQIAIAMQEPFPVLTCLVLKKRIKDEIAPALPDKFLVGSALRLQTLHLENISFPALPKLRLADLVNLYLVQIPNTGYISPETMATFLPVLTKLECLSIDFQSPTYPHRRTGHLLPLTLATLPALTYFQFQGISEYLEDLVARLNAPLLNWVYITFFNQLVFDIPQLTWFIGRTEGLSIVLLSGSLRFHLQ